MNRIIIAAMLCIACQLNPFNISAQYTGAPFCDLAVPINCFPFVASLPDQMNSNGPIPGCGGSFSFHNASWYKFELTSTAIEIVINSRFCEIGLGYQAGLYTACDPNAPPLGIQCSCTLGGVTFSAFNIPPGIYYLFLDGCSGDVCELDIELALGSIQPIDTAVGAINQPVSAFTNVCPGQVVYLTVDPVASAEFYTWNFPLGVVPLDIDETEAYVIWGPNGGPVTVTAGSFCLGSTVTSPALDFTVNSFEGFEFGEYCFPNEFGFFHSGTGSIFPAGNYDIPLITQQGCDSIVHLTVVEHTSPINFIDTSICNGEVIVIGGMTFTGTTNTEIVLSGASLYGCDSTIIVNISASPSITLQESISPASCGICSGQIDLAAGGGSPPFSYAWSNNQSTQNIGGLCAGNYTVTVSDANGCTTKATYTVGNSGGTNLSITATTSDAYCSNTCEGTIDLVIACGAPPYQVNWSAGLPDNELSVSGLCVGTYNVTVVDANNINGTASFSINSPPLLRPLFSATNVSCFGDSDGVIEMEPDGGTPPYTYNWLNLNIGNTNNASNLPSGDYSVVVTDANNCSAETVITITTPLALNISTTIVHVTCTAKGSALAMASGGTPPYNYQWSNAIGTANNDNLNPGIYIIEVQDANSCITHDTVQVLNECCELAAHLEWSDIICGAQSSGSISVVLDTAGQQPYSFEWSDSSLPNEDMVTRLSVGTYTVTMTDAEGCMVVLSTTIVQECCPEDFRTEVTHESCQGINDGAASVTINNPTNPPYTYEWSDLNLPEEAMVDNLSPGIYFVTVTNGSGCYAIDTIEVESFLDLEVTTTPADCNGFGGTATAMANGFFLNYFWSNGGTGNVQKDLLVGDYSVTVYSIFGACRSSANFSIERDENCDTSNDLIMSNPLAEVAYAANNMSMQISPNPVVGMGQLSFHLEQEEVVTIVVYDAQGRQLRSLEASSRRSAGDHRIQVDCSEWEVGLYFVEMKTASGGREVMKWMKLK